MNEPLLLVGGSVRAAAVSAHRAGFEPLAIDRFGDADLQEMCGKFQRYDQLRQLPELAKRMPLTDWIYTGPLENHPALIDQLGKLRHLLGNDSATLRRLRDPWCLAAVLGAAGVPSPGLVAAGEIPGGRNWLRKPLRTAGGFGIARCDREGTGGDHRDSSYFQEFISGCSIGATFLAAEGRTMLIGVTEQLLGPAWGGAREFQYAGSVGPVILSTEHLQALQRVGDCIAENFPMRGLFGVDAIINEDGVWPVEVNPRYTASVEILERSLDIAAIRWHVQACRQGELPAFTCESAREDNRDRYGKVIVYANQQVAIDASLQRAFGERNREAADPMIADIPVAGTSIARGDPVVTVFSRGKTCVEAKEGLRKASTDVKRLIETGTGPA